MKKTIAEQLNIKEFPFVINDNKDNLIYFEDSNGDWFKYKRNEKGSVIYCEDSNGDWYRYERDEQGSLIYYEDSTGTIRDNRIKEMTKEEAEKEFKIKIV